MIPRAEGTRRSRTLRSPVLHDAGHFLYALERVEARGRAVIQPPGSRSGANASAAHKRVRRWLDFASVESLAGRAAG